MEFKLLQQAPTAYTAYQKDICLSIYQLQNQKYATEFRMSTYLYSTLAKLNASS